MSEPLASCRVLVVDDEQFLCDMLTRLLSRRDYEVVAFSDGGSALELLRKEPFDAVLLDIRMPEPDGVSICHELRTFSDAVVIMLTALNRPDDVIHGFMAGADDYITKPFRLRELDARIRANVRRAMLSHRLEHTASDYTDDLALNYETREVLIANQVRQFPVKEFALLSYLVERAISPLKNLNCSGKYGATKMQHARIWSRRRCAVCASNWKRTRPALSVL